MSVAEFFEKIDNKVEKFVFTFIEWLAKFFLFFITIIPTIHIFLSKGTCVVDDCECTVKNDAGKVWKFSVKCSDVPFLYRAVESKGVLK